MSFKPTKNELLNLENALKHPQFRSMLCEYAKELKNPQNQSQFEAEMVQYEREANNVDCLFLHPQPGYVLKTTNLRTDEKVFVNVCVEDNVPTPVTQDCDTSQGLKVSLPYFQTQPRKDLDKGNRACVVYDVIFNPTCLEMNAMKAMVTQTALEAVDKAFQTKLDKKNVRYPKMKFKGNFQPTVIRKQLDIANGESDDDLGVERDRIPEHTVKYRHVMDGYPVNGVGQERPDEVVIDVMLPEFESANGVDLDITEKSLTMTTTEPVVYSLSLNFSYNVLEEKAKAKFDRSKHMLRVVAPVKALDNEIKRLVSTDSGIDVDTGYYELNEVDSPQANHQDNEEIKSEDSALFPAYSCNIYEDVMIFTLDVNRVSESSLVKTAMCTENFGFSLKFSSVGAGMVPFEYKFFCALEMDISLASVDPLNNMEVEVWDNNVIVKVTLPKGSECLKYKVGSSPHDLTLHSLPQLKALRKKREELNKKIENNKKAETTDDTNKERHSSGDSDDSFLSAAENDTSLGEIEERKDNEETEIKQIRSILKSRKQRCFSESTKDIMSWNSGHSTEDTIGEDDEAFDGSLSKKSVRFSETVQKHVFRPTSSILGQTSKNLKKKLAKQRRAERRASEGDESMASSLDTNKSETEPDLKLEEEAVSEVNNDSGVASSVEDNHGAKNKKSGNKKKRNKGNRSQRNKQFLSSEATNDLIFDLDDI